MKRFHRLLFSLFTGIGVFVEPLPAQTGAGSGSGGKPPPVGQVQPVTSLPMSIPFEIWNGLCVVKAGLGSEDLEPAIVDTSLPICILSTQSKQASRYPTEGVWDIQTLGGPARVPGIKPPMLRIERAVLTGVPTGLFDLYSHLSTRPSPNTPMLWIGASALAAFTLTFDPIKREIVLRPSNAPLPRGATVVPFEMEAGRIWVRVTANGKKTFRALLCTASMGTLLPREVARALNLPVATTLPATTSAGKEGKVSAVELSEIAVGGAKARDMQALYLEEWDRSHPDPDLGVLGMDFLLRFRTTIHYGLRRIAFEKLPAAPPPPKTDLKKEPGGAME